VAPRVSAARGQLVPGTVADGRQVSAATGEYPDGISLYPLQLKRSAPPADATR
jgi:hypothetical protein